MKKLLSTFLLATALGAKDPAGLINIGNQCYQNASLQCFNNINVLSDYLLAAQYGDCYIYERDGKPTIAKVYTDLIRSLRGASGAYKPEAFCGRSWEVFGLGAYQQEDAGEFVTYLLDRLSDEDVKPECKASYGYPLEAYKKTVVAQMFNIGLESTVESKNCPERSVKIEPTKMLTVQIPVTVPVSSLQDLLNNFTQGEAMTGDNQWKCEALAVNVDAQKTVSLYTAPDVFIIQLKRFSLIEKKGPAGNVIGYDASKIKNPVTFPLSLDARPYFSDDSPQKGFARYELIGVTIHSGDYKYDPKAGTFRSGGHYWAYIKSGGQWYNANDSSVTGLSLAKIRLLETQGFIEKGGTPYILYYKRVPNMVFPEITSAELEQRFSAFGITQEMLSSFFMHEMATKNIKDIGIQTLVDGVNQGLVTVEKLIGDIKEVTGIKVKAPEELKRDLAQLEVGLAALSIRLP